MKTYILFLISGVFLFTPELRADSIDALLRKHINFFGITPLPNLQKAPPQEIYDLGRHLFIAPIIAGNRNINCLTCHNPALGTSDGRRLSQTHNGQGILKRNSQSLFNLGLSGKHQMFWDGRVSYNPVTKSFQTPEPALNGKSPLRPDITNVMTSALAMQVIFPMVSHEEMRGSPGENEIANANTNLDAWDLIVKRVSNHRMFKQQLQKAFPNVTEYNIGHLGEALAQFIAYEFYSNNSPFNKYLEGNEAALTLRQKEGFRLFIEKGKCIGCHQGSELGLNNFYASVGVPQFGSKPFAMDLGRAEVPGHQNERLLFRTPGLLNLKVTGPYYHNGAYATIREVINHYSDINTAINNYTFKPEDLAAFPVPVEIATEQKSRDEIFASIQAPFLRQGINFTEGEKDALEDFLTNALMDPKFDAPAPKESAINVHN